MDRISKWVFHTQNTFNYKDHSVWSLSDWNANNIKRYRQNTLYCKDLLECELSLWQGRNMTYKLFFFCPCMFCRCCCGIMEHFKAAFNINMEGYFMESNYNLMWGRHPLILRNMEWNVSLACLTNSCHILSSNTEVWIFLLIPGREILIFF